MNLWQVEHFLSDLLWDQSKSVEKGSIGQKFICSEVTSYKIHISVFHKIKSCYLTFF